MREWQLDLNLEKKNTIKCKIIPAKINVRKKLIYFNGFYLYQKL